MNLQNTTQRNQNIFIWIAKLIVVALIVSCAESPIISNTGEGGTSTVVDLSLSIGSFQSPSAASSTRGDATDISTQNFHIALGDTVVDATATVDRVTRSDGTTPLYNLWVLQFGSDKKLRRATKLSNLPEPIKDMVTIQVELYTGTGQTLYLVSLGTLFGNTDLSTITTIKELEEFSIPCIEFNHGVAHNLIQSPEEIPYSGFCEGIEIVQGENGSDIGYIKYNPSSDFTGGISIRALITKLTFSFSYDVQNYTPHLLMLHNISTTFNINPPTNYKSSIYASLPAIALNASDFTNGKRYTASWYIAPNRQGIVPSIKEQRDRYFYYTTGASSIGSAPPDATYINLWAADGKKPNNYAIYYIFPGSNTTNDFNLHPNGHYILRSTINITPDGIDKRVIAKELFAEINLGASAVGKFPNTMASVRVNAKYDIDAASGVRPIEFTALQGNVTVQVLDKANSTTPMPMNNSWLKLSTTPRYTEALNLHNTGNSQGLTTELTFNMNIAGTRTLYLHNDEYEEYTSKDPAATTLKRSLFLRFIFRTSETNFTEHVYRMDQRRGFYVGLVGGVRDAQGNFSHGLVCGNSFNLNHDAFLAHQKTSYNAAPYLKSGLYPEITSFQQLINEYKVDDRVSGKEITRFYAENHYNHLNIQLTKDKTIPAPHRINGKLDLYQYQFRYNNTDGFAARWCYDKNRDKNGNGVIDEEEFEWYLPAFDQLRLIMVNYYGHNTAVYKAMFDAQYISATFFDNESHYVPFPGRAILRTPTSFSEHNSQVRCVKNVKHPVPLPPGEILITVPEVGTEAGYVVVDNTGLEPGCYDYKKTGDIYITDEGRYRRHLVGSVGDHTLNTVVSARFRVSPINVLVNGTASNDYSLSEAKMTWAEAAGYNKSANNLDLDMLADPADTGCSQYKGRSDVAEIYTNLGKWRLPTLNELIIIETLDPLSALTNAETGYQLMTYPSVTTPSTNVSAVGYWATTESNKDGGNSLIENYKVDALGNITQKSRITPGGHKNQEHYIRCIQDLPSK